ncbi:unnamed protein product [Adineta steineri]|uniref:RING-type domain-containing protein n=1 Tax=Adineta steineri TaxID=433720 RepID=A0A815XXH0_9BILA|nr:unnamed protein product [Adineta steineri]CAF1562982.1 unnamed protein product [Adineta steineri]
MPLFTREFVSCHAKPSESHLYNDPVMLICSHVFCRSCCLYLAESSNDKSIMCPICSTRIPFDNINRFTNSLISHGTLATMVKQYLREEHKPNLCYSCQNNCIDDNEKFCQKCEIQYENLKRKIVETMKTCEELLENQKKISFDKIHEEINQLYVTIDQRTLNFNENIDKYQKELENVLIRQQKANENNASKHQPIDINTVSKLVEPRLNALKNNNNILENIKVEKEIKRLNEEADRQLRLLKHKADIVPILSPPKTKSSINILGELRFKSMNSDSKISDASSDQSMINSYGDTSFQSIPTKLPMWTVLVKALPTHLCVYPLGKSTLIFSCSSDGIISLLNYISPVTYDSPRYIRSFNLFPEQTHVFVQSFTVFSRFMLVHTREKDKIDYLFIFSHEGILEYGPIQLSNPIGQYLADENRLWAIDTITQTIFFHTQPLLTDEISFKLSKRDNFISFDDTSEFIPFRIAINHQLLAILSKDLQQVYIYNKMSRERIFVSHFTAGNSMNIWDIGLFPRDHSLLLKFDWKSDGVIKHSLFIHFNTKNQSVGRIEGKHCLDVVIGPNKEILIGFNLRTGIIRCYM